MNYNPFGKSYDQVKLFENSEGGVADVSNIIVLEGTEINKNGNNIIKFPLQT